MKITWLGQAGLLFETQDMKIMVDPYLSDSVKKVEPKNYRRVPVDESFFDIHPDVIVCTHNHLDHVDPETLPRFLERHDKVISVLAPTNAWRNVRTFEEGHNYIWFNPHTTVTVGGVTFTAVKAEHSDETAIGFILDDGEKKYYITGDTLYNEDIFKDLPDDIYAVFLPINGVGNNMNFADAKKFCEKVDAKVAVPMHCGLFDNLDMTKWEYENKTVPEFYKEIILE